MADPHIIEECLNHIDNPAKRKVAGVYNRALYRQQKRAAFETWERFFLERNVIQAPPDAPGNQAEPTAHHDRRLTAA